MRRVALLILLPLLLFADVVILYGELLDWEWGLEFTAGSWVIAAIIILLVIYRLLVIIKPRMPRSARQPTPVLSFAEVAAAPVLDYAPPPAPRDPDPPTFADHLYFALTIACYVMALSLLLHGPSPPLRRHIIQFEKSGLLGAIVIFSSSCLFLGGVVHLAAVGWRRVASLVMSGLVLAGVLPVFVVLIYR